jgi:anti-sigma factor RsiW
VRTCQDFATDLELHHDGELDPPGVSRLERHLAACETCRARSDALAWLGTELRARDSAAPGPDLWASIAARLPELDAIAPHDAPWWRRLLVRPGLLRPLAATLAFATITGVLLLVRTPVPIDIVRSIDAKGRPVMVIPSSDEATIIWLIDDGGETLGSGDATKGL